MDPVERVKLAHVLFNAGEFDDAIGMVSPDVEYVPPGGQPPVRGADRLREWMEPDAFDAQQIEALELRAANDRVLVHGHARNRAAASGIEMELDFWSVWTLDEDGTIVRIQTFLRHEEEEALRAAGLDPQ